MFQYTLCDLCGERAAQELSRVRDLRKGADGAYLLLQCRRCELIRLAPMPDSSLAPSSCDQPATVGSSAHMMHAIRTGEHWQRLKRASLTQSHGYPKCDHSMLWRVLGALAGFLFAGRLSRIPRYRAGGYLLDVGSGSGLYVDAMCRLGWRAFGIDKMVMPSLPKGHLRRQALCAGRAERLPFAKRSFHVVTFWHSLEHCDAPLEALREARRVLTPFYPVGCLPESMAAEIAGEVLIEVPNYASWQARLFGRRWFHLDPPRHRYHFTPQTLAGLLRKAGFSAIQLHHCPSAIGWAGSFRLALSCVKTAQSSTFLSISLFEQALFLPLAWLEARCGHGGCLRVSAQLIAGQSPLSCQGEGQPQTSIILVAWNCWEHLQRCLTSLFHHASEEEMEVIVVDNASSDDTAQLVHERWPMVKLIRMDHNAGFSAGANQGIHRARGRYIWILNPDTEVESEVLPALRECLDAHPAAAVVGPRLLADNGSTDPRSARRYPSLFSVALELTGLHALKARLEKIDTHRNGIRSVPAVSGAAMLIRREALDEVGLFDERFFLYGEDLDLCRRLRKAGWDILLCGTATIRHIGGGCTASLAAEAGLHALNSMGLYLRTYHGQFIAKIYWTMVALSSWSKGIVFQTISLLPFKSVRHHSALKRQLHARIVALAWERLRG